MTFYVFGQEPWGRSATNQLQAHLKDILRHDTERKMRAVRQKWVSKGGVCTEEKTSFDVDLPYFALRPPSLAHEANAKVA